MVRFRPIVSRIGPQAGEILYEEQDNDGAAHHIDEAGRQWNSRYDWP
jgi:hypothetical protein